MGFEPPLDPPDGPEDQFDDCIIRGRMYDRAWEKYPPFENIDEFYESLESPRERKAFCVTQLLDLLPDEDWEAVKEGSLVDLWRTWRDFKYLKANRSLDKKEMYPVVYGIVEQFFEDVILPTEEEADDYTDKDTKNPFDKMFFEIATHFDDRNSYYDDYVEYFGENYIDYGDIVDELIAEKKEDRALASVDYPPPDEEY